MLDRFIVEKKQILLEQFTTSKPTVTFLRCKNGENCHAEFGCDFSMHTACSLSVKQHPSKSSSLAWPKKEKEIDQRVGDREQRETVKRWRKGWMGLVTVCKCVKTKVSNRSWEEEVRHMAEGGADYVCNSCLNMKKSFNKNQWPRSKRFGIKKATLNCGIQNLVLAFKTLK